MLLGNLKKRRRKDLFADREPTRRGSYVSPLLEELFRHWPPSCRLSLLELSGGSNETLEAFSKLRAKVVVEDIGAELLSCPSIEYRRAPELSAALHHEEPFDLILCWDLLNYLGAEEVGSMGEQLLPLSSEYTVVYALVSALMSIPAEPGTFSVSDDGGVEFAFKEGENVRCPRYSVGRIQRLFTGFEVDRMRLLQNGYYEVLFRRHRH